VILIIGSNGQLGRQMQRQLTKRGLDYAAYDYPDIDIVQYNSIEVLTKSAKPSVIVNCAAYTNVDKAESDEDNAYKINALGPKNLAEICTENNIELVHVSTDYVFSGEPIIENGQARPYIEEDECAPATAYGRTKLAGERYVQEYCPNSYILRTAWLYGDGHNFVRSMLRLAESRDTLTVVNDQIGSPTSAADLAEAVCKIIGTGEFGLYHATCEGQCSWNEFAKMIFRLKDKLVTVMPATSAEYAKTNPSAAPRPKWSVLENARLKRIGKNVFRNWEDSLCEYLLAE
jgi:dTDP-4-dehydrorhamnose reductase